MRRKDREITDMKEIMAIVKKCDACSLAFFDEEYPYVVPVNFGAELQGDKLLLYIHGAKEGKKIELLKRNNRVAFEMNCSHRLIIDENPCKSTMEFESVCGTGIIKILENEKEKVTALTSIMSQYVPKEGFNFQEASIRAVTVLKLSVQAVTGKRLKRS